MYWRAPGTAWAKAKYIQDNTSCIYLQAKGSVGIYDSTSDEIKNMLKNFLLTFCTAFFPQVGKEMALFFFLEEVWTDESNKENLIQLQVLGRISDGTETDNCYCVCFIFSEAFFFYNIYNSEKFIQLEDNYLLRNEVPVSLPSHFLTCHVLPSSLKALAISRKPNRLVIENRRKNI